MFHKKFTATFDKTSIHMVGIEVPVSHSRVKYAAGPVYLTLGGVSLSEPEPTFAVMCVRDDGDTEKYITLRKDCVTWLTAHGCDVVVAELLLDLAKESEAAMIPSLEIQETRGQFLEEVQKIADGYKGAIRIGEYTTQHRVKNALFDTAKKSSYAANGKLALVTLACTNPPSHELLETAAGQIYAQVLLALDADPEYRKLAA